MASPFQYVTPPAGSVNPTSLSDWKSTALTWLGAVLIADDDGDGDLAVRAQSPLVVLLRQLGIEALEHSLADAAVLAEPGRGGEHEDVAGHDRLPDARPLVTVPHVELDARADVVVDDADDRAGDVVPGQRVEDLLGEQLGARLGR